MASLTQEIAFTVPPQSVYDVLTIEELHAAATGAKASIPSRDVGAKFTAWDGYIEGEHLELVPGKLVVQKWRGSNWAPGVYSRAEFRLEADPDNANHTKLVFTHSEVPDEHAKSIESGWHEHYWEPMRKYFESHGAKRTQRTAEPPEHCDSDAKMSKKGFCWFDIPATDIEAVGTFFGKLFDMSFMEVFPGVKAFFVKRTKYAVAGCIYKSTEHSGDGAIPSFNTPDLDASIKKAVELGGKLEKGPEPVGPWGMSAILRNPEGLQFGLFCPKGGAENEMFAALHAASGNSGETGVCWIDIPTPDIAATKKFYGDVFGWTFTEWVDGDDVMAIINIAPSEFAISGTFTQSTKPRGKATLPHIFVPSIEEAVKTFVAHGGKLIRDKYPIGEHGFNADLQDPQGLDIRIYELPDNSPSKATVFA